MKLQVERINDLKQELKDVETRLRESEVGLGKLEKIAIEKSEEVKRSMNVNYKAGDIVDLKGCVPAGTQEKWIVNKKTKTGMLHIENINDTRERQTITYDIEANRPLMEAITEIMKDVAKAEEIHEEIKRLNREGANA